MPNPPTNSSLKIQVLASGSGGNSILISSKETILLIDAGLTCKELARRLARANRSLDSVSAVIVTHEHQDHIRGAGVISRRHSIPIYMNGATRDNLHASIGEMPTAQIFSTGDMLEIGDLTIQTYPVAHDAADPIGLAVRNCSRSVGVALDMGYPTKLVRERLRGSHALILEFNHDLDMLRQCNRPWELKQRIMSKTGHMSNQAALEFLSDLIHDELRAVVLAHVSQEANCGEVLFSMVSEYLRRAGRGDIEILLGSQEGVGNPIRI